MISIVRPRIARFASLAIVVFACVVTLGALAVFCVSEWKLRRIHHVPLAVPRTTLASPSLAEGARMAKIVGCWAGCHGRKGEGGSVVMEGYYSVTAPTLTAVVPLYSDAELARLVRFGIKRDGRSALGMTSYTFFPLADADLANITAHLRRQPPQLPVPRHRTVTWAARVELAQGKWQVAADQLDPGRPRWGELPRTTSFERGRYLASVTCTECHGLDFRGSTFKDNTHDGGPSLAIIAIYRADEFRTLLRTGTPIGGRDLGEMSWAAREGFVHFTDEEIDDIRVFLRKQHGIADPDGAS